MLRFQLEVSLALVASALGSLFALFTTRTKEGKIRLPAYAGESEGVPTGHDPFDVTTEVDILDGYPIDLDVFWMKMRQKKLVMSLLLAIVVVVNSTLLGWSLANSDTLDVVVPTLQTSVSTYLLILAVRSFKQDSHSKYVIHVAVLSTWATALLSFIAILPDTPPVAWSVKGVSALRLLGLSRVFFYLLASLFALTTPLGPPLHYRPEDIYFEKTVQSTSNAVEENVSASVGASLWNRLLFSYTTKVVWLGNIAASLEVGDLPIVPSDMRATVNYSRMKKAMGEVRLNIGRWSPQPGSGWTLGYRLLRVNVSVLLIMVALAAVAACLFYAPAIFMKLFVGYLEVDADRKNLAWGWVYVIGLLMSNMVTFLVTGQLWSISTTTIQVRFRTQLNSILFAKTLVRKDTASLTTVAKPGEEGREAKGDKDEDDFSSKAQIMTLMTTDVDRVSELSWHIFALVDSPIEIVIGTIFLYKLLGVSCFFGLAVTCLFLPLNHFAGKVVIGAQENLMKARDERVALMNEILGAIRMLKFMAWERNFEARVMKIRKKELKYQKLNYSIETLWNAIWNGSPIIVTLVTFWHFTVIRKESLTPSIAFTAILVFSEMKFALNALPETFISALQCLVSLRRIEKYMIGGETAPVLPIDQQPETIAFQSCTATWSQDRSLASASVTPSAASTPRHKFMLIDMNLAFPTGELSLVCGKLGSGKTLLLLSLLGESDILSGQVISPRSPPDAVASFASAVIPPKDWVVKGLCAYVPQAAWLRNASIKENILFNLPLDEERYQKTLEVCALLNDLEILEDGDESEIGERGVNLSGGQKARVSLARAIYSRASVLLLDDVLSAVDAHTAYHLYHECLKGDLMQGRTVILVSHHVQLCAPGASYIVALDNGRLQFSGDYQSFQNSGVIRTLVHSTNSGNNKDEEAPEVKNKPSGSDSESASTVTAAVPDVKTDRKPPRKLVEEEKRAVGRISRDVWETYIHACGNGWYWILFILVLIVASLNPVFENGWLRYWSDAVLQHEPGSPIFYIAVYAAISTAGLIITTIRWFILYDGSIRASNVLHKRLLEAVLFASIRFHDTVSRGRLLNRFGKDFEGIDSSLSDNFGRSIVYGLSALTTLVTVSVVGGPLFIFALLIFGMVYYNTAKIYGQTSRDMRRLDSVTRSPLYSIYGETIAGVTIIRAFGASSKFLRDMLRYVDTNSNPYYWMWGVNRWLSVRFNLVSSAIVGATALVSLITPSISASFAGFALAFASTITNDLLFMVRRFVGLEQSMVALERVKEYSELKREAPEFIEPRPPATWPPAGAIDCEGLVIRYAPELPNVLHNLNFSIQPGEKVGILGRTGSGKSTLALSFFRFVEPTEGRILVDGVDITNVGLTDLRSRLTIIPQDPTILSGTLRSTLDVFDEYQDVEIFEALRRVHLIPSEDTPPTEDSETVNENVFRNLDSVVSEGGENFSTGEKQLLCMARAILKRSRVLVMDEATASVDYATDELIGKTIRTEFAESTILTIAHRLRTVIDYDRVMLLDQGHLVEFDHPSVLLQDPNSRFYALCKATGKEEFATLRKMAGSLA